MVLQEIQTGPNAGQSNQHHSLNQSNPDHSLNQASLIPITA